MEPVRIARPLIGEEERAAVDRVLRSGSISQGPEVVAFEEEFSSLVEGRDCVAVNSGTSALHLALLSIGVGPGDEVIVPSFTFAATANAVHLAGARAVFADIEPDTFCLDAEAVAAAVTDRTAAIMPVHLYGHPAGMDLIGEVADRHDLAIVEDAAQAHAAIFQGRPVGALGAAAAFSFYPTKNMTTGEGGLIVFEDAAAARTARLLRNQGMDRQYGNEIVGFNLRMTDTAAAIGRVQLRRLESFTAARRANAHKLSAALAGSPVRPPVERPGCEHVYHQYTVRTDDRTALLRRCERAGIEARVYYPTPVHELPSFSLDLDLPETAAATSEVVSLPVGPHLDGSDVDRIVAAIR